MTDQGKTAKPRVLITGATGFIGRHALRPIARRTDVVRAMKSRPVDLLDRAARRAFVDAAEADILVHIAWHTAQREDWNAPENDAWAEASQDLFKRFFETGGRRILGIGTCAEYDWSTGGRLLETAPTQPQTRFGQAKLATWTALERLAKEYKAEAAWGRVFFPFGPDEPQTRLVPLMLRSILSGEPLDCGPAETVRDISDVRDLGRAISHLALSSITGPVNLGGGEPVRLDGLARVIERLSGRKSPIRFGVRDLRPGEPLELVADTSRLMAEVGHRRRISLAAGIAHYLTKLGKKKRAG